MNLFALFVLGLLATIPSVPSADGAKHLGLTQTDRFLLCAQEAFGKPALREASPLFRQDETLPCPGTRDEVRAELVKRGVRLFELEDWLLLEPEYRLKQEPFSPYGRWKKISVAPKISAWQGMPGSRALTPKEQAEVSGIVFQKARLSPIVAASLEPGADGETAHAAPPLIFDVHRLNGSVESVIGLSQAIEGGGVVRLIYGELRKEGYVLLWDSPLFGGWHLKMGYQDLDGDGTKEILVFWSGGHYREVYHLAAFDTRGHEITRQPSPCGVLGYAEVAEEEVTCPIEGNLMSMEDDGEGRMAIHLTATIPHEGQTRLDEGLW